MDDGIKGDVVLPEISTGKDWESRLSARNYTFDMQIDKFVVNTKQRLLNVAAQSILETVKDVQTTIYEGGKMRFKTGFLRRSGTGSLNAPPTGPDKGDPKGKYTWSSDSVVALLAKMKIGDVFYFGWTANYAKYREAYDGFLESAVQKWQSHVDKAVAYYKQKDGNK